MFQLFNIYIYGIQYIKLARISFTRALTILIKMGRSKSPKDNAPSFEKDPEARQRARLAQSSRSKKKENFFDKYSYHIVFGVFGAIMVFALLTTFWKSGPNIKTTDVNDAQFIQEINSKGLGFSVGPVQLFNDYKLIDAKHLINSLATNKQQLNRCNSGKEATIVPETFNFRTAFPKCAGPIYNQGNCSSGYSIAAVSAISDRWCKLNPQKFPRLSPQTPISCDKAINNNCKGGYVSRTLDFAKIYGLVQQNCYPFNVENKDTSDQCNEKTSKCPKHKIADYCVSSQQEALKQQVFNHGPVVSVIPVYRDFLIYKKGAYKVQPSAQKYSSGHSVKIIGWDEIDGKNCWLVENSWGEDWGQNGIGCIVMNQDELQMERFAVAAALNNQQIVSTQQVDMGTEGEDAEQGKEQAEQMAL